MSLTAFPAGQTDVTTYWVAYNNTTGARRTDIVHNTTALNLGYIRNRAAEVIAVTGGGTAPVTLAADNTAHTDWGFRHIGGGVYRVDFPDAAFATGVDFVILDVFGPTDTVFVAVTGQVDILSSNPRTATDATLAAAVVEAEWTALKSLARTGTNGNGGLSITMPNTGAQTATIAVNANASPITDFG